MKLTLATLLPILALLVGCSDKGGDDTDAAAEDTGTAETLPTDGTDPVDADGDGYTADDDCDDSNPYINPGAEEICDEVDNDCNDLIDDDALGAPTWFADSDDDGYGDYDVSLVACSQPEGYSSSSEDCDDTDPAYNPGAAEDDCTDPNDYNCDGFVDFVDEDGDGFAECEDCDDDPETGGDVGPGTEEVCDGLDNNCDGSIDNDAIDGTAWYPDDDYDGYGSDADAVIACDEPEGYISVGGDCDDTDRGVSPGATEYCNEIDDDCDATIDEDAADLITWYLDDDNDTYGVTSDAVEACSAPAGYVGEPGDCDDTDVTINPVASETCDEVDQDCDGLVDEDPTDGVFLYADADDDGFGDADALYNACETADGYTEDDQDCDDSNAAVNPDAEETCGDGLDNDCDGVVDNASDVATLYPDEDGDGFGVDGDTVESCELIDGYSGTNTDCDDEDADIFPGADEVCDEADQDCDEVVDEDAIDGTDWYIDDDEDGYGGDASLLTSCDEPEGYTDRGGDCDDADADYNPGAVEDDCTDPNDYNCDGSVGYTDADGDGYAACEECDDGQEYVYPGATELCDGQPNDCDTVDLWTDDDGIVTLFPSGGGTPIDYTASFTAGGSSSAPEVNISTSGELEVCDGTYYVRPRITSSQLKITGSSPEDVVISGGRTGQGPILMNADAITLDVSGLTVTGGDGCFGGINGMYTSTCSGGSIGWSSYVDITLNVHDVVITDNDSPYGYYYYGGGISMRSGYATVTDTAIYNNNMNGIFAHDTQVVCVGDSDIAAGTWDNTFYGMHAYDVFYGPSSFTSTECDFDQGLPNGSGSLSHTYASSACGTYADDETFYCDETGCDYCP